MELKWNLEGLFKNIDECYTAFKEVDDLSGALDDYKGVTLTSETLLELLDKYFICKALAYKILVYGSLRYYQNVNDESTIKLKSDVEKLNNDLDGRLAFATELILREGKDSIFSMVEEEGGLQKYRVFLDDVFRKKEHVVSDERIVTLNNEINDYIKKYNELLKGINFKSIVVDGKEEELNSSNIQKFLSSRDRSTRSQAFFSVNNAYKDRATEIASILNEIMKRRVEISRIEGYKSVLEKSLDAENIDPKIVSELIRVVKENTSLLQNYMALKAKYMKLEAPHLYDLGIPLDRGNKKKYPLDEAVGIIKNAFAPLGNRYVQEIDGLMSNGHIDATLDENKHQSITFSWYGYSFLNYRESYNDLKNLAHELGHSINDSLSANLPFPYQISSVFIGETASIVNEILLNRSLLSAAATEEERLFYLSKEIDNYVTSVYRQTMYTELENALYALVESGVELTSDILSKTYFDLLKSYYGPNIVYDEESAVEWTRLGHLIRWAYYPYKYATGLLIASTVHASLLDGSLPIEDYMEFLSSGSKDYSLNLLKLLHIDMAELNILGRGFEVLKGDLKDLDSLIEEQDFHI